MKQTLASAAEIRELARKELEAEAFRAAVDAEKSRLRQSRWWHKFVPKIIITWSK